MSLQKVTKVSVDQTHALSDKLLKNQMIFNTSLETIQQFEIVMVSCRIKFNHFEGDQSTYRLRCKRCNNIIFPKTDICTLLNGGPAAMLIHMDLDGTTECDSENFDKYAMLFNRSPLMHSSVEAKEVSYASLNGY